MDLSCGFSYWVKKYSEELPEAQVMEKKEFLELLEKLTQPCELAGQ